MSAIEKIDVKINDAMETFKQSRADEITLAQQLEQIRKRTLLLDGAIQGLQQLKAELEADEAPSAEEGTDNIVPLGLDAAADEGQEEGTTEV